MSYASDNHDSDRQAILAVEAAYDRAWSGGDLDALLRCLTSDALLVNPRGEVAIGQEEIRRVLGAFWSQEAPTSTHASRVFRITFVTDDVAMVDGEAQVEGAGLHITHQFTDALVRTPDGWAIAQVRAYAFMSKGG